MIGQMNQVVTVYTASFAADGMGGREKTTTSIGQYWARVDHLGGEEREHALRDADKMSVAFTMHNFEGFPVSTTSIIEFNGVKYDIVDREYVGTQQLYIKFKGVGGEYLG